MSQIKGKVVGIDLGTTNSVIAYIEGNSPVVIANRNGSRTTPSVVAVNPKSKDWIVGITAKNQAVSNAENTFYSVKRLIGRKYDEVAMERNRMSYKTVSNEDGNIQISCPSLGQSLQPEEISAQVLLQLIEDARKYINEPINQAVITVPAYFNELQRQSTIVAGRKAGLRVLKIINEPTAASLAYSFKNLVYGRKIGKQTILVFDLGGGTFDVSIFKADNGAFDVLATTGNSRLGGDDFDQRIVNWLVQEFKKLEGIDLANSNLTTKRRLIEAAEAAKISLSFDLEVEIHLPFLEQSKGLVVTFTREKFEALCADLIESCRIPVKNALEEAQLKPSQIDEVVLAGGSTRIPAIQRLVRELLGKEPNQTVNPDEVVAVGAAVQAGILSGEFPYKLNDITPFSLGIAVEGGVMKTIISRNSKLPIQGTGNISTAKDNQTSARIRVFQGESSRIEENTFLHEFIFDGIPPAPRGVPRIQLTYEMNENAILRVLAENTDTGKSKLLDIRLFHAIEELKVTIQDFPPQLREEAAKILNDIKREVSKPDSNSNILKERGNKLIQIFKVAKKTAGAAIFLYSLISGTLDD